MAGPRQKGPIQVTLLMASFGYKEADPDDMEFMTIIRQIETENAVVVEVDGENNWVDIYASTKDNATNAMDRVRAALKLEVGGAKVWHPSVLMAPVTVGKKGFMALLAQMPDGARPYMSPKAGPATNNAEFNQLYAKWQTGFREKLFQAVKQIRSTPSEMRMRVQLGTLLLQEWKKNVTEYTYGELENVIKRLGIRGTFSFSQMLGNAQLAHNLLTKIYASPSYFEPVGTRIGKLEQIKPKHTLILTTSGLKVETEVISVQDTDSGKAMLRLGAAKGYRRERRSRAVEIATSCPEHKYDWNLAVRTQVPVASLPFSHIDITNHSKFTRRPDPCEFPDVRMQQEFVRTFQVEQITGKTSWVFTIKGSSYAIEVALYNVIAAAGDDAGKLEEGGCGVDFFRPGWDDLLTARSVAAGVRELSEDCRELFPFLEKKLGDQDGVEALARRIAEVHNLVSGMDDKPPVRIAESVVPETEEEDLLLSWD
ncbi:hypothetical protein CONLIGDRAFT_675438 [Coniochaeta ligniaria NRRL 30616]|uniref:DUF7905 domain-containing protein n=1 Tax=Coniochaeta ligniaria NRRL 30616 TaxID=1408157 RepID=A0A1J7J4S5_9PEZI|nr:hypothetical protein CONLIGDRAFT_675438 [Coniochaeta ligniaria NRRL 30616]